MVLRIASPLVNLIIPLEYAAALIPNPERHLLDQGFEVIAWHALLDSYVEHRVDHVLACLHA